MKKMTCNASLLIIASLLFGTLTAHGHEITAGGTSWKTESNRKRGDCSGETISEATLYGPTSYGLTQADINAIAKMTLIIEWPKVRRNRQSPDLSIPTAVVPANTSLKNQETATELIYDPQHHQHIRIDPKTTYMVLTSADPGDTFRRRYGLYYILAEYGPDDDRPAEYIQPQLNAGIGRCGRLPDEKIPMAT